MIQKIIVGGLSTNCYVYVDELSKEAMVIDPGGDAERIYQYVVDAKIDVRYIVITHGHYDHISGVSELKNKLDEILAIPVEIFISEVDSSFINSTSKNLSPIPVEEFKPTRLLKDGSKIELGATKFTVITTPGHTPGSISLYTDGILFSGDTMFYQAVGRTDLYGGNQISLADSIEKLKKLPPETIVYPGHGKQTTIQNEKQYWR